MHECRTGLISELRAAPGATPRIVGHAARFNVTSESLGYFRERIVPGAFKDSIRTDDIRALFNHDPNIVLGRNKAGTLRLNEDYFGLAVEIDPPNTERVHDLIRSIERGDITGGMSFSFDCVEDEWSIEDDETIRTLKRVKLFEVSPVTFPAYSQTDVNTRSLDSIWKEGQRRLSRSSNAGSGIALLRRRLELEANA